MSEKTPQIKNRESWLKVGVVLLFSLLFAYKIAVAPLSIDLGAFNFSDLLALLLSLFAIGMSVAFYFKATYTSNQFYDNTFRFTKEISEMLGRIEAGFGERLRHLDEGYTGLCERFETGTVDPAKVIAAIGKEKEVVAQKEKEREKLVEELARRAKLQEDEKEKLFSELRNKELELYNARHELEFMRHRAKREQDDLGPEIHGISSNIRSYIKTRVIPEIGGAEQVASLSTTSVKRRFDSIKEQFHPDFLKDLASSKLASSDGLELYGAKVFRRIARGMLLEKKD